MIEKIFYFISLIAGALSYYGIFIYNLVLAYHDFKHGGNLIDNISLFFLMLSWRVLMQFKIGAVKN